MNQKKIGSFLKELRKEKGITQEEFAENLNVSGRTVSRWETGVNMPDISLLVDIAEFFNVSIPEIINGERKSEIMEKEVKEVAEAMSNYAGHLRRELRSYPTRRAGPVPVPPAACAPACARGKARRKHRIGVEIGEDGS